MVALLLAVLAADMPPPLHFYERSSGSSGPGFVLAEDYEFPSADPRVPVCVGDAHCVYVCTPNAGNTAWTCIDNTGASVTVTQGTSTAFSTALGVNTMVNVDDSTSPSATIDTANAAWAGDVTVIWAAYSTTAQDSSIQGHLYDTDGNNGLYVRFESGALACTWLEDPSFPISSGLASGKDGWSVNTCRRSGNNRVTRMNGQNGTPVTTSTTKHAAPNGTLTRWGRIGNAGHALNGPMAWVAMYSEAKSDAWLTNVENNFWGAHGLAVSNVTTHLEGVDNLVRTGKVDMVASGAIIVDLDGGIRTERASQNYCATDPLAAATWTDVGTPTVTSNVASGPFSTWHNTAEVDRIVDDDGAAFEGKETTLSITDAGWVTASYVVAAGDTGTVKTKARIAIVTDGTGSTNCDFSNLAASYGRISCSALITGSPTATKGRLLVGNAASDTGSVLVSQCQLNPGPYAGVLAVDATAGGSAYGTIDATTWTSITATGGKEEVVFTPLWDPNAQWFSPNDTTLYLWDTVDATPEHGLTDIFGYTTPGRALFVDRNAGVASDLIVDGVSLTPGQLYAVATEFVALGGGKCNVKAYLNSCGSTAPSACHATTLVASDLSGTATCTSQPATAYLGNRFDLSIPTSVFINAARIYTVSP